MADRRQDLLGRLADLSEEAVQRLSEAPGADRVDELQRRTKGFEELEKRLATLEKKVDSMTKPGRGAASGARPKSGSTPKKP